MGTTSRFEIFTRQGDVAELTEYGEIRLGGITLYGKSSTELEHAVARLEARVEDIVRNLPSAEKRGFAALLHNSIDGLDRRVGSAIIGSLLRQGRIASLPGEDERGDLVCILCAPEKRADFDARVQALEQQLRTDRQAMIKSLRKAFFPDEGSGTWTFTWHVAAHAVFRGSVCFIDRYQVSSAGGFNDVVGAAR